MGFELTTLVVIGVIYSAFRKLGVIYSAFRKLGIIYSVCSKLMQYLTFVSFR
jgi:hypothetical protein